jgi:hypothetical protein
MAIQRRHEDEQPPPAARRESLALPALPRAFSLVEIIARDCADDEEGAPWKHPNLALPVPRKKAINPRLAPLRLALGMLQTNGLEPRIEHWVSHDLAIYGK